MYIEVNCTDLECGSDLVTKEPEEFKIGVVMGEEGESQEEGVLHPEEWHQHQRRSRPLPLDLRAPEKKKNTRVVWLGIVCAVRRRVAAETPMGRDRT